MSQSIVSQPDRHSPVAKQEYPPKFQLSTVVEGFSDIERLIAIEHIKRTKAFYCLALDTKSWDTYQGVFTDDALLEIPSQGKGHETMQLRGAAAIRQRVEGLIGQSETCHQCHSPIIDFTSPGTANVVWAMEDMLRFEAGKPIAALHGMGHYVERYRRCDDGYWRIAYSRLERLRLEMEPLADSD